MNYKKIYDQLIEHARGSIRETGEIHHVIPRCLGGTDEASNLVRLSVHEHIWAHIWLAQIYPDVFGLQLAVSFMVFGDNENLGRIPTEAQIKDSGEARERARKAQSGQMRGNLLWLGKSHSEETKQRLSEASHGNTNWLGKSHSEETKRKLSENARWRGKLPWLNPKTLRSPKSLQAWYNADDYFKLWKEHQCADVKLAKLFRVSWSGAHRSLVLKFRAGWVPNEDAEWQAFKDSYK